MHPIHFYHLYLINTSHVYTRFWSYLYPICLFSPSITRFISPIRFINATSIPGFAVVGWWYFQCRGVLLIWIRVGQGLTAGGGCLDIFLVYHFSFLSSSLWEMARYRLTYRLKGPLTQLYCLGSKVLLKQICQSLRLLTSRHSTSSF